MCPLKLITNKQMKRKEISFTDILSAFVFIPESPVLIINYLRLIVKSMVRFIAKVVIVFL
ncbi:MAG: hypothetical protein DRI95_04305 [Bacteroidetes bacterium]|nr:MAG: hypothetical protein DRI95_04305 [Bacteroidota bacterium]